MEIIKSKNNNVLCQNNLLEALQVLKGYVAILYIGEPLANIAEILCKGGVNRYFQNIIKNCTIQQINNYLTSEDYPNSLIKIIPQIDENLDDYSWYLVNKNGKYFSNGTGKEEVKK